MKKRIEHNILILMARNNLAQGQIESLQATLKENLDWEYLIDQLEKHKLLPLFLEHMVTGTVAQLPRDVINAVRLKCELGINSARLLDSECVQITKTLSANSINYAVLKGPVLAHGIYNTPRKRAYRDIDILVRDKDCEVISRCLKDTGYIQGRVVAGEDEIKPASRKGIVWCRVYMPYLFPFVQLKDGHVLTIQVHIKLFPYNRKTGREIYTIDLSDGGYLWGNLQHFSINKSDVLTLCWEYFLLHMCLDTYSDEISIQKMFFEKSGLLRAYCDIQEFICLRDHEITWSLFIELVKESKTQEPVCYVLSNLTNIYKEMSYLIETVVSKIRPNKQDFMHEFGLPWETVTDQRGKWSRPFMERLFDNSPKEDYERQSALFGDPNWAKLY